MQPRPESLQGDMALPATASQPGVLRNIYCAQCTYVQHLLLRVVTLTNTLQKRITNHTKQQGRAAQSSECSCRAGGDSGQCCPGPATQHPLHQGRWWKVGTGEGTLLHFQLSISTTILSFTLSVKNSRDSQSFFQQIGFQWKIVCFTKHSVSFRVQILLGAHFSHQ